MLLQFRGRSRDVGGADGFVRILRALARGIHVRGLRQLPRVLLPMKSRTSASALSAMRVESVRM